MTTRDARRNPWGIIAALSLEGTASGSLYVDDGENVVQNETLYVEVYLSLFLSSELLYSVRKKYANTLDLNSSPPPTTPSLPSQGGRIMILIPSLMLLYWEYRIW